MDDVTFENRLIGTGRDKCNMVAASMGFSGTGRYHYLDHQYALTSYRATSNVVILGIDMDVLLGKFNGNEFFKYLRDILYNAVMSDDPEDKTFPPEFDRRDIRPLMKHLYEDMKYGDPEVLYSRMVTSLMARNLIVTMGDNNKRLVYTVQLHMPKFVMMSLYGLASSLYNWSDSYGVNALILTDTVLTTGSVLGSTQAVFDIYLREFGMMNSIVHDPHVKSKDDIERFSTEYTTIGAKFYHLIMAMAISKWRPPEGIDSKIDDKSTLADYIHADVTRLHTFFTLANAEYSVKDKFARIPNIGSLLYEKDGAYFKQRYNVKITEIKGWSTAYSCMRWMNIYAKVTTAISVLTALVSIFKSNKHKTEDQNVGKPDSSTNIDHRGV